MKLHPVSNYTVELDTNLRETINCFKNRLENENKFQLDSFFGKNNASYNGKIEEEKIFLTRRIDNFFSIPVYPTAKIEFLEKESKTLVKVNFSLSYLWLIIIYLIYFLITLGLLINWQNSKSILDKEILLLKSIGLFFAIYVVILSYHFSEYQNVKKIIKKLVIETIGTHTKNLKQDT